MLNNGIPVVEVARFLHPHNYFPTDLGIQVQIRNRVYIKYQHDAVAISVGGRALALTLVYFL